ncbi:preprotein translocase subunit SecE [Propionibacteriaceae bacterium Y1685]
MAEDKELDPTESDPVSGDPVDVDPTDDAATEETAADDVTAEDEAALVNDDADDELVDEAESVEDESSDHKELVTAGAATKSSGKAKSGSAKGSSDKAGKSGGKGRPTPKQKTAVDTPTRTGPVTFVKESAAELRKVVYPTGEQLRTFFIVVLVFVLFIIGFSSLLDFAFGWLVLRIFG